MTVNIVKRFSIIVLAVLAGGLILPTCTHEYIENINEVCFEEEVQPIFQANCAYSGCHNPADREAGYDLTTYEGISRGVVPGHYRQSVVYSVLINPLGGAQMPPKPYTQLSDAQLKSIALWIEQGAQNTTNCNSGSACDTTAVTYSGSVQPILQSLCTTCHSGNPPQGGIDLSTYASVKARVAGGSLVGVIEHQPGFSPMPKDGNKLSACNIAKIKKWVALGAKND